VDCFHRVSRVEEQVSVEQLQKSVDSLDTDVPIRHNRTAAIDDENAVQASRSKQGGGEVQNVGTSGTDLGMLRKCVESAGPG
jgi:hypothetical protein